MTPDHEHACGHSRLGLREGAAMSEPGGVEVQAACGSVRHRCLSTVGAVVI